jgi:hypothetical protein
MVTHITIAMATIQLQLLCYKNSKFYVIIIFPAKAEEMETDDDDDGVPMVTIGDQKVAINEVSEDMVEQMTPSEKEAYIKLGQEMYADMYE